MRVRDLRAVISAIAAVQSVVNTNWKFNKICGILLNPAAGGFAEGIKYKVEQISTCLSSAEF